MFWPSSTFNFINSKVITSFNNELLSRSTIIFVGLVESIKTSDSEPSTFRVMNIPKKPQAAISSSFDTDNWAVSTPAFRHSLMIMGKGGRGSLSVDV